MANRYLTTDEKHAWQKARLDELQTMFGRDVRVKVTANKMAAGPCTGCLALENAEWHTAREVPLMPLSTCPHPDQCAGHYRMVLNLD